MGGPNNLYLQNSSSGNDQSSVVYRNQNMPQESTKNNVQHATFFSSDEKIQDKIVNKSAANKIQKSQGSRITMQNGRWSGGVSVKTQARFQNIINKN